MNYKFNSMTQEELLEYNKRCAEFLGYELITPQMRKNPEQWKGSYWEHKNKANVHTSKKVLGLDGYLSFHSDWNWIMEICIGIENIQIKGQYIYSIQPRGAACEIKCSTQYSLAFDVEMPCIYEVAKSKKEAVVQAINKFLIWYNEIQINKH